MKAVHLTNRELRTAFSRGLDSLQDEKREHLAICDECALALSFIKAFPVSGQPPLTDAPSYAMTKAIQIPSERSKRSIARQVIEAATLLFDSWTTPIPAGVRSGVRSSRRLRYSAPHCQLDLQTTRVQQGWECTAKIISDNADTPDILTVQVGRQKYPADPSGFVTWQSTRPPQTVRVMNGAAVLLLAEVAWSDLSPQ